MLRTRLITAAILAPLAILVVLKLPSPVFNALLAVLLLMAAWEWGSLLSPQNNIRAGYCLLTLACFVLSHLMLDLTLWIWLCALVGGLGWIAASYWLWRHADPDRHLGNRLWAIIGLAILTLCWTALAALHKMYGPGTALFVIVLVWIADSSAYFAGRQFGKNKLAPHISPGKTREGVYGALGACLIAAVIGAQFLNGGLWFILLTMITVIVSVFGDLFESLLKRQHDTKDSSHLLPGHGGILDRLDSLFAASPVFLLTMLLTS